MDATKKSVTALRWIIDILSQVNAPYLICGGFAANLYGATRPLNDIDLYIPQSFFNDTVALGQPFVSYGPSRYRDEHWDVEYVQFLVDGVKIEVGHEQDLCLFNSNLGQWEKQILVFDQFELANYFDIQVRLMNKQSLIRYKQLLGRAVDLIDIQQITGIKSPLL